jgi:hypothetical protein
MNERVKKPPTGRTESRAGHASWRVKLCRPGFLCLLLALATLVVFLPVARQGFVNYDDSDYVTENAHVQSGLQWAECGLGLHDRPRQQLASVDVALPHAGLPALRRSRPARNTWSAWASTSPTRCCSFLLLRRMTGALWRSALVAALVCLAPVACRIGGLGFRAQGRAERLLLPAHARGAIRPLCGGGQIRSTRAEIRGKPEIRKSKAPKSRSHAPTHRDTRHASRFTALPHVSFFPAPIFMLPLLFFGLMSKPMLVTLPFVLLLLDYWPLRSASELSTFNPQPSTLFPAGGGESAVRPAGGGFERHHVYRAKKGRRGLDQPAGRRAGGQRAGFVRPLYRQDVLAAGPLHPLPASRATGRPGR